MNQKIIFILGLILFLTALSGCSDINGDDYQDAPDSIQDESLDYQDYKDAGCPYLDDSLDQETMDKCNEWIKNNTTSNRLFV